MVALGAVLRDKSAFPSWLARNTASDMRRWEVPFLLMIFVSVLDLLVWWLLSSPLWVDTPWERLCKCRQVHDAFH